MPTFRGVVRDGRVTPDMPLDLPDGAAVQIAVSRYATDDENWSEVTDAEAVVLDELLRRLSFNGRLSIEHEAERVALRNLQCFFESQGNNPRRPPLEEARTSLLFEE